MIFHHKNLAHYFVLMRQKKSIAKNSGKAFIFFIDAHHTFYFFQEEQKTHKQTPTRLLSDRQASKIITQLLPRKFHTKRVKPAVLPIWKNIVDCF